jgi:hypothetical protein
MGRRRWGIRVAHLRAPDGSVIERNEPPQSYAGYHLLAGRMEYLGACHREDM